MIYWKKLFYRTLYRLFCLIPGASYVCFIEHKISNNYSNLNCVLEEINEELKIVRIEGDKYSFSRIWKIARSRVLLIDQSSILLSNLKIDKKTKCIQLWHSGGLYKKVGFDALRKDFDEESEKRRVRRVHSNIDWFIISDQKLINKYACAFGLHHNQVLPLGLPRTDRLYKNDSIRARKVFFKHFSRFHGRKILLYAPTFRACNKAPSRTHSYQLNISDLHHLIGDEWCFALRRHPSVFENVPEGWLDVSQFALEDCLSFTDVLITDYSSILFDYSFFRRPILLFVPDLEVYRIEQRGLYVEPEEIVGIENVCRTSQDIAKRLRGNIFSDYHIWENYMSSCDGHSSERVSAFVKKLYEGV